MQRWHKRLWMFIIVTFVVGDLVTTFVGMSKPALGEANPLAREMYNNGVYHGLLLFKLITTGGLYVIDRWLVNKISLPIVSGMFAYIGLDVIIRNLLVLELLDVDPMILAGIIVLVGFGCFEGKKVIQ